MSTETIAQKSNKESVQKTVQEKYGAAARQVSQTSASRLLRPGLHLLRPHH